MKTVKQLITELSKYPDDMFIVINGYEGVFGDAKNPEELIVVDFYLKISNNQFNNKKL